MYSVASIKACESRTIDCFDVPLNQRIGSGLKAGASDLSAIELTARRRRAKPGHGGVLPAAKVSAEIALARGRTDWCRLRANDQVQHCSFEQNPARAKEAGK